MKKIWVLSIVLLITAAIGFACSGDAAAPTRPPTATSPTMTEPTATAPAIVEPTATPGEGAPVLAQQLVASNGCLGCHTTDGTALVGPSWKGLYGSTKSLADGSSVTADEAYIEESILNPTAKVAEGFPPIMPPFTFSANDLQAIVAFIKSLE